MVADKKEMRKNQTICVYTYYMWVRVTSKLFFSFRDKRTFKLKKKQRQYDLIDRLCNGKFVQ